MKLDAHLITACIFASLSTVTWLATSYHEKRLAQEHFETVLRCKQESLALQESAAIPDGVIIVVDSQAPSDSEEKYHIYSSLECAKLLEPRK